MYRILFADCDAATRARYAQMKVWRECAFYIADEADSAASALGFLRKNKYDLLITEVKMPITDGISLAEQALELLPDLCVIFVSSCLDYPYVHRAMLLGASDYLPITADETTIARSLGRIKQALDGRLHLAPPVLAAMSTLGIAAEPNSMPFRFCRYFSEHYERGVTMEQMAAHFGYSKDYFGKLFKESMTVSFNRFHSLLRIEYAKELLESGSYKIYEISELLGYSSVDYFTKLFRQQTGSAPSDYRASLCRS